MAQVRQSSAETLRWIKPELESSLSRVRRALEANLDTPEDRLPLQRALLELHQIRGSLTMVQCHGGGLLVEEMKAALQHLMARRSEAQDSAFEAMLGASLQLADYLDLLIAGQPDNALVFHPLVNELRVACKRSVVSEAAFFSEYLKRLNHRPEPPGLGGDRPGAQSVAKRYLPVYQAAMLSWIKEKDVPATLKRLRWIGEEIAKVAEQEGTYYLGRLLGAVAETLMEGDNEDNLEVKRLFGRAGQQLKLIAEQDEGGEAEVPQALLHQLLYVLGRSTSESPRVESLCEQWSLREVLPPTAGLNAMRKRLRGPNTQLMQKLSDALKEDLASAKDIIDLVARAGEKSPAGLEEAIVTVERISNTLGMLGLEMLQRVARNQTTMIEKLRDEPTEDPQPWLNVAVTLLRIEHSIDQALFRHLQRGEESPEVDIDEAQPSSLEVSTGSDAILRESLVNLARVKGSVDAYVREGEPGELNEVLRLLHEVEAGVRMLGEEGGADCVARLRDFFGSDLTPRLRSDDTLLSDAAESISVVEYYLEQLRSDTRSGGAVIDDVRSTLARLDRQAHALEVGEEEEAGLSVTESDAEVETVEVADTAETDFLTGDGQGVVDDTPEQPPVVMDDEDDGQGATVETGEAPAETVQHVDPEIREVFIEEADEVMRQLQADHARWSSDHKDMEVLREIRRAFHTLKGSGRMVGAMQVGDSAWHVEDLLNNSLDGSVPMSNEVIAVVDRAMQSMPTLIEDFTAGRESDPAVIAQLKAMAAEARGEASPPVAAPSVTPQQPEQVKQPEPGQPGPETDRAGDAAAGVSQNLFSIFRDDAQKRLAVLRHAADAQGVRIDPAWQRALHALANGAERVRDQAMARIALSLEELLEAMRIGNATLDQDAAALISAVGDNLASRLKAHGSPGYRPEPPDDMLEKIDGVRQALPEDVIALAQEQKLAVTFTDEACDLLDNAETELSKWMARPGPHGLPLVSTQLAALRDAADTAEVSGISSLCAAILELASVTAHVSEGRSAAVDGMTVEDRFIEAFDGLYELLDRYRHGERDAELPELVEGVRGFSQQLSLQHGDGVDDSFGADLESGLEMDFSSGIAVDTQPDTEVEEEGEAEPTEPEPTFEMPSTEDDSIDQQEHPEEELIFDLEDLPAGDEPGAAEPVFDDTDDEPQPPSAEPPADVAQSEDSQADEALLEIFAAEATEILDALDAEHERWEGDLNDQAPRRAILRLLHTLKGSARMARAESIGDLSHELESLIGEVEIGRRQPDAEVSGLTRDSIDGLHALLDRVKAGQVDASAAAYIARLRGDESARQEQAGGLDMETADPEFEDALPDVADTDADTRPTEAETPARAEAPDSVWDSRLYWRPDTGGREVALAADETARVPVQNLDDLLNQAGEVNIFRARLDQQTVTFRAQLVELERTVERIREQLRKLDVEAETQIQAGKRPGQATSEGGEFTDFGDLYQGEFDALEMDRYTRLNELTRGLSESATDLASLHGSMSMLSSDTESLLVQQGRAASTLQQGLMQTLMVPFSRQLPRLERVIRQTAQDTGKRAALRYSGVNEELDRKVLERIAGPLEHLVRNAVVHGIESPSQRSQSGKEEQGVINVAVQREGSQVLIEVRDDGAGIDLAVVRQRALEKGLIEADVGLEDDALMQLIFVPGFSTATELTQSAGRGVGMDVVDAEIKKLGGSVVVSSDAGAGCRVVIRLPLNLALTHALMVQVADETYAVPLRSIEGVSRVSRDKLMAHDQGKPYTIGYGGRDYTFRALSSLLGLESRASEIEGLSVPVLLVAAGDVRLALAADLVVATREVVVKNPGPQVSSVPGVTGATVMPDGSVILILDPADLVHGLSRRRAESVGAPAEPQIEEAQDERRTIMVVDDSITMRRVAERLLERNGYRVLTAKDGMDALTQLQSEKPDLMLLDIEMPRVDGFELATYVRNANHLGDTPIIMITSRGGQKHRERAEGIGVNHYLVKPYQDQEMLQVVSELLAEHQGN